MKDLEGILTSRADNNVPTVCLVSTGGTIAGLSCGPDAASGQLTYRSAQLEATDLIQDLPDLKATFNWRFESPYQIGSQNLEWRHMLMMHQLLIRLLEDTSVDAIVVTHGTDCLEDMLFFLHLCLPAKLQQSKPLLFVAAMLPADHPQADGPVNLSNALNLADDLIGQKKSFFGAVLHGLRTPAEHVRKMHTTDISAFDSQWGVSVKAPLTQAQPFKHNSPTAGLFSAVLAAQLHSLGLEKTELRLLSADVCVAYCAPGLPTPLLRAGQGDDAGHLPMAFVIAAPGHGSIPDAWSDFINEALQQGNLLIRSSRVGEGGVSEGGEYQIPASFERHFDERAMGGPEGVVGLSAVEIKWAGMWNSHSMSIPQCLVFARLALFEMNILQ